jgi:hypothetical protein
MGILKLVESWIKRPSEPGDGDMLVVVDATPAPGGKGGEVRPQEQLLALRRLGTFVAKEKTRATVIFPGKALRRIDDGSVHDGVLVRFAESRAQLIPLVCTVVKDGGKRGATVVVTSNPEVEVAVSALGAGVMRLTTFDKALDSIAGPARPEPRKPQSQPPAPETAGGQPSETKPAPQDSSPSSAESQAKPPPEPDVDKKEAAILDLIDPL